MLKQNASYVNPDWKDRKSSSMASCIAYWCTKANQLSIEVLVSDVYIPLCEAVENTKQIEEILLVILQYIPQKSIVESPELCWFMAKALCHFSAEDENTNLNVSQQSLITQCSALRNVKGNVQFDQYLTYIRHAYYPAAEVTAVAVVMDKTRGVSLSAKSTMGNRFATLQETDNRDEIQQPKSLPSLNTELPLKKEIEDLWQRLEACEMPNRSFSMWGPVFRTQEPTAPPVNLGNSSSSSSGKKEEIQPSSSSNSNHSASGSSSSSSRGWFWNRPNNNRGSSAVAVPVSHDNNNSDSYVEAVISPIEVEATVVGDATVVIDATAVVDENANRNSSSPSASTGIK